MPPDPQAIADRVTAADRCRQARVDQEGARRVRARLRQSRRHPDRGWLLRGARAGADRRAAVPVRLHEGADGQDHPRGDVDRRAGDRRRQAENVLESHLTLRRLVDPRRLFGGRCRRHRADACHPAGFKPAARPARLQRGGDPRGSQMVWPVWLRRGQRLDVRYAARRDGEPRRPAHEPVRHDGYAGISWLRAGHDADRLRFHRPAGPRSLERLLRRCLQDRALYHQSSAFTLTAQETGLLRHLIREGAGHGGR